ncbi:DNA topoisomerase IB [Allosphingosinicella flava]|uniref:DNA topoisomerase n=1 Tax=Allosphingosinicella flava TaxID=2771430 RepID=A0A7T2LNK0_9SPHN|nr:DNA topoisomerase IB [Sphingosinicella flava]QPQ56272.1 DNA topoisomerase IB [Sphingosinicella flava]
MLCFVDDALPGITRRRAGRGWAYYDAKGDRIVDRAEIDRLNRVGLPPAYTDAWFCPSPHGHIQAIGYDDKGRKQYRYHLDFRAQREAEKYDRCASFGRSLPLLRARVAEDIAGRKLGRDAVVAAVVRLMDLGFVRVGNEAYAQANKSFGATTLRTRHVSVTGKTVKMRFKGKSGQLQELSITDRNLTRMVKKCQDLPGQHLFQYVDDQGEPQPVSSSDVNAYIRDAMGQDFTAKHFRTWGASVIAFEQICAAGEKGLTLKRLLAPVAKALGNTPAISRKSYVHPALIDLVKAHEGEPLDGLQCPRPTKYLSSAERGLIDFLDTLAAETEAGIQAA